MLVLALLFSGEVTETVVFRFCVARWAVIECWDALLEIVRGIGDELLTSASELCLLVRHDGDYMLNERGLGMQWQKREKRRLLCSSWMSRLARNGKAAFNFPGLKVSHAIQGWLPLKFTFGCINL